MRHTLKVSRGLFDTAAYLQATTNNKVQVRSTSTMPLPRTTPHFPNPPTTRTKAPSHVTTKVGRHPATTPSMALSTDSQPHRPEATIMHITTPILCLLPLGNLALARPQTMIVRGLDRHLFKNPKCQPNICDPSSGVTTGCCHGGNCGCEYDFLLTERQVDGLAVARGFDVARAM